MLSNALNVFNTRDEEKIEPVKKPYFNETSKVIQQFIKDEEAEDRRTSPQHRIYHLKKALSSARNSETHHRLKNEIEDLEEKIQFGEASRVVHTLPEEKKDMIMENYHIEKSEAESVLSDTNAKIEELESQLSKIKSELKIKRRESHDLVKMLDEATAVQMAYDGNLEAYYRDDHPIYYRRSKGFSELRYLRIEHLKGDE